MFSMRACMSYCAVNEFLFPDLCTTPKTVEGDYQAAMEKLGQIPYCMDKYESTLAKCDIL